MAAGAEGTGEGTKGPTVAEIFGESIFGNAATCILFHAERVSPLLFDDFRVNETGAGAEADAGRYIRRVELRFADLRDFFREETEDLRDLREEREEELFDELLDELLDELEDFTVFLFATTFPFRPSIFSLYHFDPRMCDRG